MQHWHKSIGNLLTWAEIILQSDFNSIHYVKCAMGHLQLNHIHSNQLS